MPETGYTILNDTKTSVNYDLWGHFPSGRIAVHQMHSFGASTSKVTFMEYVYLCRYASVWNYSHTRMSAAKERASASALFRSESDSCVQSDIYAYTSSCITSK